MDFDLTETQTEILALAGAIFTREKREEDAWAQLGKAGLLDGTHDDLLAHCALMYAAGAAAATTPIHSVTTAAIALAKLGAPATQAVLALHEPDGADPYAARTTFTDGRLTGVKTCVPASASHAIVSTTTGLALVDLGGAGVAREAQTSTTGAPHEQLTFGATPATSIGDLAAQAWLLDVAAIGLCAMELGICETVLRKTAAYTSQRVQFDRPIATFQAVAQRAADAYIDVETLRVTTWEAAWRLANDLPAAREVAIAKAIAAEAGARVVYAAQHLHGGIGFDLEFGLARYYPLSKWIELQLGGASAHYARLGALLSST
jgi:alkylation response protein AidB-like acyl-CoA dehydrogenase